MTQTPAHVIVQEYHRAWTSRDIDRAMALIADDVICRAPAKT